jgi:hypothetical protein
MISVRNLALFGTDWFGANLLDQYHLSFAFVGRQFRHNPDRGAVGISAPSPDRGPQRR